MASNTKKLKNTILKNKF